MMTDGSSRARIDVGSIGIVDVEPNSRVRLIVSRWGEHRMALDRGQIRALIWAPPRLFFVNTPSSTAIDLGCAYTLKVDDRGWGQIVVESGWVAFQHGGRESFIPQDAMCATRPGIGPGTPCYTDAAPEIAEALTILDFSPTQDVKRRRRSTRCLTLSRPKDALTLWHLLSRGTPAERTASTTGWHRSCLPPEATRDAVLRGDGARSTRGGTRSVSTAPRGGGSGSGNGKNSAQGPLGSAVFLVVFIGAQAFRPDRTNPPSVPGASLCHTRRRKSPRSSIGRAATATSTRRGGREYTNVSPTSWLVANHVHHAREHFNYSQWTSIDEDDQDRLLGGMCSLTERGRMPLPIC